MPDRARRLMVRCTLTLAVGWLVIPAAGQAWSAEPIATERFETLRTVIRPKPGEERWLQVPWLINLTEARRKAAAEGKPILLWEMDGHPFGCT
jgi:hypothetical protein